MHLKRENTASEYLGYFDGAARGNLGPAGTGCILVDPDGKIVWEHSEFIGYNTNNTAEYTTSLLRLLQKALELGISRLKIFGDSQLVVYQVLGDWKINQFHLQDLCYQVIAMLDRFDRWQLVWIPRKENARADKLSNQAFGAKPIKGSFTGEIQQMTENIFYCIRYRILCS